MDPNVARCAPAPSEEAGTPPDVEDRGDLRASAIAVLIASPRGLEQLSRRLQQEADLLILAGPVNRPEQLVSRLFEHQPRVLLLDQSYLGRLGHRFVQHLQSEPAKLRVVLICDRADRALVELVLRNGFHGFLPANAAPEVFLKSIRAVHRGEFWLPRTLMAEALAEHLHTRSSGNSIKPQPLGQAWDLLTPRESQVVDFLRQGYTNKQIATELGVMEDTVKKHLQNIFRKLGVHRRILVAMPRHAIGAA